MDFFLFFWLGYILVGLAVEFYAIYRKAEGDTLSEQVWRLLRWKPIFRWVGAGFMFWLSFHFLMPSIVECVKSIQSCF